MKVPPLQECRRSVETFNPRVVLPLSKENFFPTLPVSRPNAAKYRLWANTYNLGMPRDKVEDLLCCLENCFSTGCRSFFDFVRDYSSDGKLSDVKQVLVQLQEDLKLGRVAGPFKTVPFPQSWNPNQAVITRLTDVPKDKYNPDDRSVRLIFDKSFPRQRSKNTLTPRNDSGLRYWTFSQFLHELAELGPGTLMFFADVKAAYKNLVIHPSEWHMQVFKIGDDYYVDKTGVFGDVAGGDNYDRFQHIDCRITQERLGLHYLRVYVDNISDLTKPLSPYVPDWKQANCSKPKIVAHYIEANLPLHKMEGPTTRTENHLGWGLDTMEWTVFMKTSRREYLIVQLTLLRERAYFTKPELENLVGVISFCSQVMACLAAPLQYLIQKQTAWRTKMVGVKSSQVTRRENFIMRWILYYLQNWKGTLSIHSTIWTTADIIIYTDIGTANTPTTAAGIGAWSPTTNCYVSEPWQLDILRASLTEKKSNLSVPFLETYGVMVAVLALAGNNQKVQVFCDNDAATKILGKRWCKTSDRLNNYIASFDLLCTNRSLVLQVQLIGRERNSVADFLASGRPTTTSYTKVKLARLPEIF